MMGLAERRAVKAYQEERYPLLQKQVWEAAKAEIPIEVKWDTMAAEGNASSYDECWTKIYFTPLIDAFKDITRDDMGKDALKEGIEKIVIQNISGTYSSDRWATMQNKTLTLDHEPITNADYVSDRAKGLTAILEKNL